MLARHNSKRIWEPKRDSRCLRGSRSNLQLLTRKQLRTYQEVLLSWNLAFVLVCTAFLRHAKRLDHGSVTDQTYDFYYAFFRGAARTNDLLHLHSSNPSFGPLPNPGSQIGPELMFALSILCLATPLFV